MSDKKKSIMVDFDGVSHKYSKRWHYGTICNTSMEGVKIPEGVLFIDGNGFRLNYKKGFILKVEKTRNY